MLHGEDAESVCTRIRECLESWQDGPANDYMNWLSKLITEKKRETFSLRWFGLTKIPLLFYVGVSVVEISPERMVVRIPLRRRTRNHLGSMYFGALCIGADVAPGAYAMYLIRQQPVRISMVFKDFQAEFLKRAEGDVNFTCNQARRSPRWWRRRRHPMSVWKGNWISSPPSPPSATSQWQNSS